MGVTGRLLVLYGSQTFTAQEIAERIWRTTKILGFRGPVQAMDEYPISNLIHEEFAIFVCATAGQGDEPDNMKKFWKFLLRKSLPSNSLVNLKYGVVGLGDSSFAKFNFVGKKLHKRLMQLGASPIVDLGLCDYQHDLGHDAVLIPWTKQYFTKLKTYFPNIEIGDVKTTFIPRWKVTLLKNDDILEVGDQISDDIYFSKGKKDEFNDAKYFRVLKNIRTTDENHFQDVRLISLKTTENTPLDFKPGDVFSIRPRNSTADIEDLFSIFETHSIDIKPHYRLLVEESYEDMPVPPFLKEPLTLYEIAEQFWDLKAYPTQYVFSLLSLVSEDKLERDKCIELSSPEGQEEWLNYSRRPKRTILEVLSDFHKTASKLTIPVLFELFSSVKPRSFSIASAPSAHTLDILVAAVSYHTILKKAREGLCSNWLTGLRENDAVYGWIKGGTLQFPKDETIPLVLIGPGTGLAPYRGLLQDRDLRDTASKDSLHLFFGCRYKDKDFHCREELEGMVKNGQLSLYCAFSRDQENKIYVQHKISEHRDLLWDLIQRRQARLYISGNAKNMPDNVKDAIVEDVFGKTGGLGKDEGRRKLKDLEDSGRLQIETW